MGLGSGSGLRVRVRVRVRVSVRAYRVREEHVLLCYVGCDHLLHVAVRAFGHESPLGAELAAAVVGRVIVHGVELEKAVLVAVDDSLDGTLDVVDVEVEGAVARLVRVRARARARGGRRVSGRVRVS